jgi:stearoyl-CoA desaturase (delta-9 desaturase)
VRCEEGVRRVEQRRADRRLRIVDVEAGAAELALAERIGDGGTPEWPAIDRLSQSWFMRIAWGAVYSGVYIVFAPSAWWFLLLPAHFVMGPIHGAIVNWGGHMYGYRNFDLADRSRNTLILDFLTLGELFQNNHHEYSMSPNFAARKFELDPTYPVIWLLNKLGIIRDLSPQRARFPAVRQELGAAAE